MKLMIEVDFDRDDCVAVGTIMPDEELVNSLANGNLHSQIENAVADLSLIVTGLCNELNEKVLQ